MSYDDRRHQLISKTIKKIFHDLDRIKILDIGYACRINKYLTERPRFETTGLDIEKNPAQLHYPSEIQADATKDLTSLGKFDVVVAGAFIEHIENPYQFLRNVQSITHEHSILIISTPSPVGIPTLFFELISSKKYFYSKNHCFYFPPRWVERMLHSTGWEPIRKIGIGAYFIKLWFPVPYTLSYDIIYVSQKSQ
jgi:2-polyprenyl-3-methyl-5-hydroxy-6-metoxy-1,4-benzoquinol methylase